MGVVQEASVDVERLPLRRRAGKQRRPGPRIDHTIDKRVGLKLLDPLQGKGPEVPIDLERRKRVGSTFNRVCSRTTSSPVAPKLNVCGTRPLLMCVNHRNAQTANSACAERCKTDHDGGLFLHPEKLRLCGSRQRGRGGSGALLGHCRSLAGHVFCRPARNLPHKELVHQAMGFASLGQVWIADVEPSPIRRFDAGSAGCILLKAELSFLSPRNKADNKMAKLFYVACDGGGLNTLAGAGGILEIEIEPKPTMRYHEFRDGMGGSVHMVAPSPDMTRLVASSANIGQLFVMPRKGDRFDLQSPRIINEFNSLGAPRSGTDAQTAMFSFFDSRHIACQYNRKLVRVDLETGKMEVLADLAKELPDRVDIIHQISVTGDWVVMNEVVKGGIFVFNMKTGALDFMGDGFTGGHHLIYQDTAGDTIVIRPAFGFQAVDAHLKVDDNAMSFYNLTKGTVATRYFRGRFPTTIPQTYTWKMDFSTCRSRFQARSPSWSWRPVTLSHATRPGLDFSRAIRVWRWMGFTPY